jgi:beta-glucosidase
MKLRIRVFFLVLTLFAIMAFIPGSENAKKPIYLNTSYSFQERATDLVSRMTPEEKQSQLGNTMPPIPRLGVNYYDVWGEALHGVLGRNNNAGMTATSFPNSVAVGASWDPAMVKRETNFIADEARGFNYDVIFTLTYWSPVVEPVRDPRWGRTGESFGEDPFLVSKIGSGFIQGLMGNDPTYLKAVPCGKHYFANNSEFNRHNGSSNMDKRDMREFYLFPYKTLIEKDKLPAIMSCYNAVNGIPNSASKYNIDTIAKRTYGLKGYVTGDCGAISDIYSGHNYVKTGAEATALGLKSGVDSDCGSVYQTSALDALKQGLITETDIDRALINIFTIRMKLGEFDPKDRVPYRGIKPAIINDPSHNDLAVEVATRTPVLLKNNVVAKTGKKALPISADAVKKIAVIGPQADRVELGPYSGQPEAANRITPLAGIKNYIEKNKLKAEVAFSAGGNTARRSDFLTPLRFATVIKGAVKEIDAAKFDAAANGILAAARGQGPASLRGIKDGDWTAYNNIDVTNIDSLRISYTVSSTDGGTIEARIGSSTGNLIASAKIAGNPQTQGRGGFGGGGRGTTISVKASSLGISGPQTVVFVYREAEAAAIDKETLALASSSDVVLMFVGTDDRTAGEESDRFSLTLPGNQYELIKAVAAVNPNTIVVMQSLGMVEVDQFKDNTNVAGIIWTGFNGQAQGTAMAKILFGDANPGGKLNATWYKSLNDLPAITDYDLRGGQGKNGRTYMYFNKDVSFEFGFGLSYTTFAYSNFTISKNSITPNDKMTVSADVTNTGGVDGDEVVQVYVRTPDSPASLQRPIKRLRGFQRVTIPAGQTKTVAIDIDCADLWFWDAQANKLTFDQGRYIFEIGASSKDIKGRVDATMSGAFIPVLKTVVAEGDKIVLKAGNTVKTSVTASLTDDSFISLSDAPVGFKSTNPAVATVDDKGNVTAKGVGTALIYASVTYKGKTVSDFYPVKVMPEIKPASITVDGKNVVGFSPAVLTYSYLLADGSKVPVVAATTTNANVTVDVEQAKAIPGTAEVTLTDNITIEKIKYLVNFGTKSVNDEFNLTAIGKQWEWSYLRKTSNPELNKKPGSLILTAVASTKTGSSNNVENMVIQSANTDWTIDTKVVFSRRPSGNENSGILAYQDDTNFVKLAYRSSFGRRGGGGGIGAPATGVQPGSVDLVINKMGRQSSVASLSMADIIKDNNTLFLRLDKKGSVYTASCSTDGKTFKPVGTTDLIIKDVKAGLFNNVPMAQARRGGGGGGFPGAQQQTQPETPFEAAFDYFHIVNRGAK